MTYETVRYAVDGPVATVTLNRPEKLDGPLSLRLGAGPDVKEGGGRLPRQTASKLPGARVRRDAARVSVVEQPGLSAAPAS